MEAADALGKRQNHYPKLLASLAPLPVHGQECQILDVQIDSLVKDCSNFSALAMELLQSYT